MVERSAKDYYDTFTAAYVTNWGRNLHFGIYEPFMNPLNRQEMLRRMNTKVF